MSVALKLLYVKNSAETENPLACQCCLVASRTGATPCSPRSILSLIIPYYLLLFLFISNAYSGYRAWSCCSRCAGHMLVLVTCLSNILAGHGSLSVVMVYFVKFGTVSIFNFFITILDKNFTQALKMNNLLDVSTFRKILFSIFKIFVLNFKNLDRVHSCILCIHDTRGLQL